MDTVSVYERVTLAYLHALNEHHPISPLTALGTRRCGMPCSIHFRVL